MPFKKGDISWNKGKPSWNKGRPWSEAQKQKLRDAHPHLKGEKSPHWKGGIKYAKRFPEKRAFWSRQRTYRMKGANGSHTLEEWENLKKEYNFMCLCCKSFEPEIKLTEDHIVPISLGGSNNIENIQPLCVSCNSRKWLKVINYKTIHGFIR